MASTTSASTAPVSFIDAANKSAPSQCVTLPAPTLLLPQPAAALSRFSRTSAYCRKIARTMATVGEAPAAEVGPDTAEFVKAIQEAWEKVEDKYAVASLGVAGFVALWGSAGLISAVDRLPLIPGLLELVGIGYTGWFAYRNLVFRPDREALIQKIKDLYKEVIGTST